MRAPGAPQQLASVLVMMTRLLLRLLVCMRILVRQRQLLCRHLPACDTSRRRARMHHQETLFRVAVLCPQLLHDVP